MDLSFSIREGAINRSITFLQSNAPFLFSHVCPSVTPVLAADGSVVGYKDLWLTCHDVPFSPIPGLPRYRRLPALTLPGMPIGLPYCIQVTKLAIDFHPGNAIVLPAEVDPPLRPQAFALELGVAFGIACVPESVAASLISGLTRSKFLRFGPPVLPATALDSFDLSVFAVAHLERRPSAVPGAGDEIHLAVDAIEIQDIQPQGLENALECYIRAMLAGWVLPGLVIGLQPLAVNTLGIQTADAKLSAGLPANPAVQNDTLSVWLDVKLT